MKSYPLIGGKQKPSQNESEGWKKRKEKKRKKGKQNKKLNRKEKKKKKKNCVEKENGVWK